MHDPRRMNSKFLAIFGAVLIAAPLAVRAQETLDYSEGIFSGTVMLSAPLPENGTNIAVSPVEWNFQQIGWGAGFNYVYPHSGYTLATMAESGGASFLFSTMNGRITGWDINIDFSGTPGTATPTSLYATISNSGDTFTQQTSGVGCTPPPGQPDPCLPITATSNNPGSWKAVPELDPSFAIGGLVMLVGGVTVLRGRRLS